MIGAPRSGAGEKAMTRHFNNLSLGLKLNSIIFIVLAAAVNRTRNPGKRQASGQFTRTYSGCR
jgi:hypothetical protein